MYTYEPGSVTNIQVILNKRKYVIEVTASDDGRHLFFKSGFNRPWMKELKETMDKPYWCGQENPPRKSVWRVNNTKRTRFRLSFLMGHNPYSPYDDALVEWPTTRPLYDHQKELASHWYQRHYAMFAAEMGTGKSLAALEVADRLITEQKLMDPWKHIWYVGPKTGVTAIIRECKKWGFDWVPRTFTYRKLTTELEKWKGNLPTPRILIVDECSAVKTPTSQRSQAVLHLANCIHDEWGDRGYVVLMSGTPAPNKPEDWWNQCEISCPGFVREGSKNHFRNRICLIEQCETSLGVAFPKVITYLDDSEKCKKCGQLETDDKHRSHITDPITGAYIANGDYHGFERSINEVKYIYTRMAGLVNVKFKKDCLDLPEKQYEIIRIKPKPETIRAMNLIKSTNSRAITAMMHMRELSDGFRYTDVIVGEKDCPLCDGVGQTLIFAPVTEETDSFAKENATCIEELGECPTCGGSCKVPIYERTTEECHSPKDDALLELLRDQFEQYGRAVLWAGFSGTIDKLVNLIHKDKWAVLRYDSKIEGTLSDGSAISSERLLDAMDMSHPDFKALLELYPKLVVIGNPKAGGMGLTFTGSPGAIYYSNDFNGESRIQSEDRVHRAGMDENRSCTIYDLIHLPIDMYILESLKNKRRLQDMSMGQLSDALKEA